MAKAKQYLRLKLGNAVFLLPGASGYAVEQRENLNTDDVAGAVVAWREVGKRRAPAYALDAGLKPTRRDNWQRAIFINAASGAGAGFVVDDVHMLAEGETTVASFEPLGSPPTSAGHVFGGAWFDGKRMVPVLEPRALVAYLESLGEA